MLNARELFGHPAVRILLVGVPFVAVGFPYLAGWLETLDEPAWAGAIAFALFAIAIIGYLRIQRRHGLLIGAGPALFLTLYCLAFTLAMEFDLLAGERRLLTGFEDDVARSPFGLSGVGDWRYRLLRNRVSLEDFVQVQLPPYGSRAESRRAFAILLRLANQQGADGIAFDYYLEQPTDIDGLLCASVNQASAAGIAVFFGYRHCEIGSPACPGSEASAGSLRRVPVAPTLSSCLPDERLGTLAGYLEADDVIRVLPNHFKNDQQLPSLSRRIVTGLGARPASAPLTQFVPPDDARGSIVLGPEVLTDPDASLAFQDRFVMVGSNRRGDRYATPFGERLGSEIHLLAAACQLQDRCVQRGPGWLAYPVIYLMCFALVVAQVRGASVIALGAITLALSGIIALMAALAMLLWNLWVDVAFSSLALLMLVPFLIPGAARARRERQLNTIDGEVFDVFLSYNGKDRPLARDIQQQLERMGFSTWIDERRLLPGGEWQIDLEDAIKRSRSCAILIGPNVLGPWQEEELAMAKLLNKEQGLPVIPVLMPGAPTDQDRIPLRLRIRTWSDCRGGIAEKPLSAFKRILGQPLPAGETRAPVA